MSVFYASVLLLMRNCIITLSKWLLGPTVNFDNVMTKFILNEKTDAQKTDVNLSFTITRTQSGQILGINVGKRRLCCKQSYVKFIQNDASIVNSLSCYLIGYLSKSIKPHWLKS